MAPTPAPSGSTDPQTQMNTYRSFVTMLGDPKAKEEIKLKAAQELSENFEVIITSSQYPTFLDHTLPIFIKILQEGEPHFIAEYNVQQIRKLLLEMIHRLPTSDHQREHLRHHLDSIIKLMLDLMKVDNEENVLVCLRIIIELHKQFRPAFNPEIQRFLAFVKTIYKQLPNHLNKIFEAPRPMRVKDINEINLNNLLCETFTATTIQSEKKSPDGSSVSYNLIPKAILSLKVLQELPIIVVIMYQLYKQAVHQDVAEFIPLIMRTITLQPTPQVKESGSFNKEVFVDFMGAQIKTLSFLAYMARIYQTEVTKEAPLLVKGMLGLLSLCPMEVAYLRRDLLIAARHILNTDLRLEFVPVMDKLYDENILLGRGWTTYESLRPLANSVLADVVHHVRQRLSLVDLAKAVHIFSMNVHDETLPVSIQTMSCKLLLNLVDCIRLRGDADNQSATSRELLMRMLEVFVLKFKTIAKQQLPVLTRNNTAAIKVNPLQPPQGMIGMVPNQGVQAPGTPTRPPAPSTPGTPTPSPGVDVKPVVHPLINIADGARPNIKPDPEKDKTKFGFPASQANSYTVADCRSLVKTLVGGVKTVTYGCAVPRQAGVTPDATTPRPFLPFQPKETLLFIRLVKWALQALDVYTLPLAPGMAAVPAGVQRPINVPNVRTKEEKEVLEHFAGVFSMMHSQTFQEIFSNTIDYMVDRIYNNFALQIIGNSFLANPNTSPIFATVLVEYLLQHMAEMGSTVERSSLYLRLFKLVFGSVSLFPQQNEHMLKPHLHQIVNRSMELAMTAKDPYNYFLLLRALFRSIGGGSHDLLYQEFLPLLPDLLQGLNSLQSSHHKQHMKDLFVELCLTVPVRLSSLLPYLPKLMDPLVSALNGSPTLISQGLRTLELCVDNLQPDFLYEHIQPVRADLMQALWRTVRNPTDNVANVAFRVLGKFGGGNRKMMTEPQKLEFSTRDSPGPAIVASFPEYSKHIEIPVEKVIESALAALKHSNTDSFYRRLSWDVIRCFLVASLHLDDDLQSMLTLFSHPGFKEKPIVTNQGPPYKMADQQTRQIYQTALTGMFVAAAIKELRKDVLPTMVSLVRHCTLVSIAQTAGPSCMPEGTPGVTSTNGWGKEGMDAMVLLDALAVIMGHEEKELCKPGRLALVLILQTAFNILGSKERACRLPMMEYLAERMCSLCYDRAWYAKLGGCIAIKFLVERMALRWVFEHLFQFVKAQLFVMMDLTGEVSTGAIDMAKSNLEKMLAQCARPVEPDGTNEELINAQRKSVLEVTYELVRQVTCPTDSLREESMTLLKILAEAQGKSVVEVMDPHKDVLADMIPPKKHLLRHQAANAQVGLMEGNTFCTTLSPRLFTIDLNIVEHKVFFHEVMALCEVEDAQLQKCPCYKNVNNLAPLRRAALRALAACHYIEDKREKIFNALFKALDWPQPELQDAAFQCMQSFVKGFQVNMEMVHDVMRPLLMSLKDSRQLTLRGLRKLLYLVKLFPSSFKETLTEKLLFHLHTLFESLAAGNRTGEVKALLKDGETEQKAITIMGIIECIPTSEGQQLKLVSQIVRLVMHLEKQVNMEPASPFREPLMQVLLRFAKVATDVFLSDDFMKDRQKSRYLEYLIKHPDGKPFQQYLQNNSQRLQELCIGRQTTVAGQAASATLSPVDKAELRYQSIRITALLMKQDNQWLATQQALVDTYQRIWCSDDYLETHKSIDGVDALHWKEPKLLCKILLHYFGHHPNDISLLFQLLRATTARYLPDFQFLRDFLENTVAQSYTVDWKRSAFFRFVEIFPQPNLSPELKSKILQLILIPCFAVSFDRGEGDKLVGSTPTPEQDHPDNIVSVFITKVIDPENAANSSDCVRILLLQLSCLLVEQASAHIHDAGNKRQGARLRRLMTFAWPCLLGKSCVDPATRYHGHLLLSHIIARFAIHKRIVLQVFHSLLKAHAVEARSVVRQALEILTPAMPVRMEDGNTMLTHWTKKIIVEEGHSLQQLYHILQLVVRHYKVYYPVRHALVQNMGDSIQRLGLNPTATFDQRKLAVDLAEVIIKWELQRIKEEAEAQDQNVLIGVVKRPSTEDPNEANRKRLAVGNGSTPAAAVATGTEGASPPQSTAEPGSTKPIDRQHADAVINFLLRLACQVCSPTESAAAAAASAAANSAAVGGTPGEQLSRRCVNLIKAALKPDMWPHECDLKLGWFDKVLCTLESPNPHYGNICTALELLTFLVSVMTKQQILNAFKSLSKGLYLCITSTNTNVIRLIHGLLVRLMNIFPTEPATSHTASKYEELEFLYTNIERVIFDGLGNYEKNGETSPLFGTLMILKAACTNNPGYIDRLLAPFFRVLQKVQREHLHNQQANAMLNELLILCLDLIKNRVHKMMDMRKIFVNTLLVGLIERTNDAKVMKAICKMVEDWMKCGGKSALEAPSPKETSLLLVKMMAHVEKRFPEDRELNAQFLELVIQVYRDENLKHTDLTTKLEPAFLAGLRFPVPNVRAKFFEVFDQSMPKFLHERLLYIVCSQNWEHMGPHYWIKQCLELLTTTAISNVRIQLANKHHLLPSLTGAAALVSASTSGTVNIEGVPPIPIKQEQPDVSEVGCDQAVRDEELEMELQSNERERKNDARVLLPQQMKFLIKSREMTTGQFLYAAAQLCHMDTALAESMWLDVFPRLWMILSDHQRDALRTEIVPFLASGAHVIQKDCQPSALNTFTEALARCNPPVQIKPSVMLYLGKSHNLWHRMALSLEQMAIEAGANAQHKVKRDAIDCYDFEPDNSRQGEIIDSLASMYSSLCEEDMWAGLWQKQAKIRETATAIAYEQQGFFEQALGAYELAMNKIRVEYCSAPIPPNMNSEVMVWDKHWTRCAKELNQWEMLLEIGTSKINPNPMLVLESAWRVPKMTLMKEALTQVEQNCPKEYAWKVHLYRGFVAILHPEEKRLTQVDRCVELATTCCMREWRRLPRIVSHIHLPLLQAAQQIMELQEAGSIHQGLNAARTNSVHDMKAIVKTWRNRLPVIQDDLSHWSDILVWRQHHYSIIANHYDAQNEQTSNHSMLGVHASAQAIIHFGKIGRKHNLTGVCLDSLSRIYTIPSVPIVDCFQKIRQQVKCYLQMASVSGKTELQEGLEVIESTNLKYFTKEMTAEFYALKGMLLAQIGRSEEANKAFSAAVQMHDTLVKAWALWGDYLEAIFTRDPKLISIGISAIICFLHACRHQNESKSRKYLAKVLWLLTYDDDNFSLTSAVDQYSVGVPPIQWLPWIPQLLTCLARNEGKQILNLLCQVGRMFPQAIYFPIRTLYLSLKIEQRERYKAQAQAQAREAEGAANATPGAAAAAGQQPQAAQGPSEAGPIRATPSMWRCSRIMHMQRDIHPTILSSLEGVVDQMVWFRENWYEEVLRQLKQGLAKCYTIAFDERAGVSKANITPHTANFIRKIVSTFGVGIENINSSVSAAFSSAASESLARRAQLTIQDPVFQHMKRQFSADLDFSVPGSMKLHNLIAKLKKWIKLLEAKVKTLPKSFLIEEKCRFLSNFSLQTAEIELPGEFLLLKHPHYYVRISRFMPRVEIVQKHNSAARRMYIRGHNGKIYPYLVVNDSGLGDARREDRVLQALRMLNHYLGKQKETARRFLHFTVPRVVAVSPQMRLVEDNPSSISLLDILKQGCQSLGIEHETPIARYYERLVNLQARQAPVSHAVLREVLKEAQISVPRTLVRDWARRTFPTATDYWTFRKMVALQLALNCLAEYVLHLTRLNPDMLYVHQDSGFINVSYFKFDLNEQGELDSNRPVPFRLTPNLMELLGPVCVAGPLTASMIAAARCLAQPSFKVQTILRAVLKDEMIAGHKKKEDHGVGDPANAVATLAQIPADVGGDVVMAHVTRAVAAISQKLNSLANFDGVESKVSTLVAAANSHDNLCRMDPAWHPWL